MNSQDKLILNQADFQRLVSLVRATNSEVVELLEEELGRASVVPDGELPKDVVAMNSKVTFKDVESGKESVVTVVYPHEADIDEGKVSVLTPVGSALIGLRVGQDIKWPFPHGKQKKLLVLAVAS